MAVPQSEEEPLHAQGDGERENQSMGGYTTAMYTSFILVALVTAA